MKINRFLIYILFLAGGISSISAQESDQEKRSKAWEVGAGGSVFQFSRISFSNFIEQPDGYQFDLSLKQAVFGGNLYLAKELNSHFYLDLQGTVGFTKESIDNQDKNRWLFMVGPGIQWRLGEYFQSKYIDPYFRAGVSYMRKDFGISYTGTEGVAPADMEWILKNINNKDGADRKDLTPISLGAGLNTWLNDRFGIGMQADYLLMPYENVANSIQGTVRLMWRFGGKSKKTKPVVERIEIQKIIEKPVEVERIVEKEVIVKETKNLYDLFNNVLFEFDRADLTSQSETVVDEISAILKQDSSKKYLITGFTDSKGSDGYNLDLSKRRAETLVKALVSRGVPQTMLKSRGVGKSIAYAKPDAPDIVRNGDRKVTIEPVTNMDYWNYLP